MNMTRTIAAVLSLAALSAVGAAQTAVDKAIPPYKAAKGVSGKIKVAGSDSMAEEVAHWQQGFKVFYPAVITEAEGKGSGSAPPALTEGTAQFGAMSRDLKS